MQKKKRGRRAELLLHNVQRLLAKTANPLYFFFSGFGTQELRSRASAYPPAPCRHYGARVCVVSVHFRRATPGPGEIALRVWYANSQELQQAAVSRQPWRRHHLGRQQGEDQELPRS